MDEQQLDKLITDLGGKLYLVGGAVRDSLMGKEESADRDYLVTGVELLPFSRIAGKDFPVYLVAMDGVRFGSLTAQLALARTERKSGLGYHGFEIQTDPDITVEQDLIRRDLTINSIAKRVSDGKIIDPYGGRYDIFRGFLRHTSKAFAEDPLRVYRVARFAAQMGFSVHPSTRRLMLSLKEELKSLSSERVYQEMVKALVAPYPDRFFRELNGLLDVHFPEIQALKVPDRHDGTAFEHTMRVLRRGVGLTERFALLTHDLGKGVSAAPPIHNGHQKYTELIEQFSTRLRMPKKLTAFACKFMKLHMKLKVLHEMRLGRMIRLIEVDTSKFLRLTYLEGAGRYDKSLYVKHCHIVKRVLEVKKVVTGDTLIAKGIVPDKTFGEKLLQERVREYRRRQNES